MAEREASDRARDFRLKVALAGSGGGHVRQLLDLSDAWSGFDTVFITEDTALSRSISEHHRTHFVEHVALGQARLQSPLHMLRAGLRNFIQSTRIMFKERPDVIVTTGAGSAYFSVLWGRLLGARIVMVDSLARFESLSAFARYAGPLAHHRAVQSSGLRRFWPTAEVFDPIRIVDGVRPPKKALLVATVGATLPFDRLVRSVAELKARGEIPEAVIIQTGVGGLMPEGLEVVETLSFDAMKAYLRDADIVVCHAGTGSLITALREGCRVVAMPRLPGVEHYDRHQDEIARALAARGLISVAHSTEDLSAALKEARARDPIMATSDPAELTAYVKAILEKEASRRRR